MAAWQGKVGDEQFVKGWPVYIQNGHVLLIEVLRHVEDAISGCLFPLTSLIPVSPRSGDRAGARAAARRGIEADPGGPSSSLSQSPSIISILEIFTCLPALRFFFMSLLSRQSISSFPPPLKSSLKRQFFDQSYSRQLPTLG